MGTEIEIDRNDLALGFTLPFQLTKTIRRKVYPAISPDNPENSQKGKIVVITGGGTGIGAAAARVWAKAGAKGVVICGRRAAVLEKTAESVRQVVAASKAEAGVKAGPKDGNTDGTGSNTTVLAVPADIVKYDDMAGLFETVNRTFGQPADVVIASAGIILSDFKLPHEAEVEEWWSVFEVNLKGLHNTVVSFIRSQPNPKEPKGTIIGVSSCYAGHVVPANSSYTTSKYAAERYLEHVGEGYPSLRVFSMLPGLVMTDITLDSFVQYAKDEPELVGALALYLSQSKADYLKNCLTSVNWDVEEMEAKKSEIVDGKLLRSSWMPILPVSGGKGI